MYVKFCLCWYLTTGVAIELPPFNDDGVLPPGDKMTPEEFRSSMLVESSEAAGVASLQGRFYPHYPGLTSGIRDQIGNEPPFPSAFRLSRQEYKPKGIVKIVEGSERA